MKQIIISDPEGRDINKLYINLFDEHELYICGDMLDSTNSLDHSNVNEKSYNLRNIQQVLKKRYIKLIFGNRDINKIKCKFLNKLRENEIESELVNEFNNGNINLSFETYQKIKENINTKPWKSEMKNWYTFWNPDVGNKKEWNVDTNKKTENLFLNRFNDIYGVDNNPGTMSAQNLLKTIPYELGVKYESNEDYQAFIVLAVFNSMLNNNVEMDFEIPWNCKKELNNCHMNTIFFQGWLFGLYMDDKNYFCTLLTNKNVDGINDIFILSHGGICKQLAYNPNLILEYKEILGSNDKLHKLLSNAELFWEQKGGADAIVIPLTRTQIHENVRLIDINLKQILYNVLHLIEEESPLNLDILMILIISSAFNAEHFVGKIKPIYEVSSLNLVKAEFISPVISGFPEFKVNHFFCKDHTLVQIFGHKPNGYASTIKGYYFETQKTIIINLDTTNSFSTTPVNTGKSKNFIVIDSDTENMIIYASINHNLGNTKYVSENFEDNYIKQVNGIRYVSEYVSPNLEINMIINLKDEFINTILHNTKHYIDFHGLDDERIIFTINGGGFAKILFNLTHEEYQEFQSSLQQFLLSSRGTRDYLKYKKYKQKFLNLYNKNKI